MIDLGVPVPNWVPPERPGRVPVEGRSMRLEPLCATHVTELYAANSEDATIWDYLPYGPFASEAGYAGWVQEVARQDDPLFFAIREHASGCALGVASFLRINPEAGSIEVGHINMSRRLQKTRAATEALVTMIAWGFEAGYRRFEWKCNALNLSSRRAAQRLGLSYEGIFRQASVVKDHNRDTAWFAAIDQEWEELKQAYATWLDPGNFDDNGRQHRRLSDLTSPILIKTDPAI
ncbi:MAG: GNAT family protein [Pseudomonadota bacterium]